MESEDAPPPAALHFWATLLMPLGYPPQRITAPYQPQTRDYGIEAEIQPQKPDRGTSTGGFDAATGRLHHRFCAIVRRRA